MSTVIIILHYHNEYLEAFGNITETKELNSISESLTNLKMNLQEVLLQVKLDKMFI